MDVAALLGWLALAVALNTSVTAILAVLTIRSGLGAGRADLGRRATAGARARGGGMGPDRGSGAARPGRPVGPGPVTATEGSDPLAGAIDGLSRPVRRALPGRWPAARPASERPGRPASTAAAGRGRPRGPPPRPPIVSAHDRPLSEVTWATSRPSRFVPSGPHPHRDGRGRRRRHRAPMREAVHPAGSTRRARRRSPRPADRPVECPSRCRAATDPGPEPAWARSPVSAR